MSDSVQQIKDKLSILDVISPYVELHKAGKNFKGKSPFAAEKTPSFYVSPDRGMYYCFSTSQGGDMFNFIQVMEGVDFKESLKMLAQKAGVELVAEDPRKRSERERLFAALEAATVFYSKWLDKDEDAKAYLVKRGVKAETIAKWRIGYAPGAPKYGWRETKDALEAEGFKIDELLKTGLIKNTEGGKDPFDVFRDRIVFPMAEANGKNVAFSGRILTPDTKAPKYVNSPETELYKKSELLYGYDKAKAGIRTLNFSLIVEGQFDVVMCHQAGYGNTVAVSGTALTLHHVQLLERLSDKVVLALDADRAGINAMKKGAALMLGRGLDVKVAELPLGQDPADMIQANPTDFKHVIGKSVHVIEFLLHVLRREITEERMFRNKVQQEIYPFILLLPNRTEQYSFAEVIATFIGVPIDIVWHEIESLRESQKEVVRREGERASNHAPTPVRLTTSQVSVDAMQRTYDYLCAAVLVLDGAMKTVVEAELQAIVQLRTLPETAETVLAGLVFDLEQQFDGMPTLAKQEEIVAKLNQLKNSVIKGKINEYRTAMILADQEGDTAASEQAWKMIQTYETSRKEPPYTVAVFGV